MSATHNGTCQVCGRLQAFANGGIAKHGYTVEYGYFQGTCPGSHHLALEMDRTFADEVAASIRKQEAHEAQQVKLIDAGKLFPKEARNGQQERYERKTPYGLRTSWRDVMVPYAEAPAHHQLQAVEMARHQHEQLRRLAADTAKGITDRANRITGKQQLSKRATEAKKVLQAGSVVRLGGKDGRDVTVLRVEHRTCHGCGPYKNGQYLPHIVFLGHDGKERATPCYGIRQANIVKE